MKKILLITLSFICTFCVNTEAQIYYGGSVISIININLADDSASNIIPDTATSPLWQFGITHKPFFATDSIGVIAIMTDTINTYPIMQTIISS